MNLKSKSATGKEGPLLCYRWRFLAASKALDFENVAGSKMAPYYYCTNQPAFSGLPTSIALAISIQVLISC